MKKDKEVYDNVCEYLSPHLNKDMEVLELACWFRVIIVIEANSYVNKGVQDFYQSLKLKK